MAGDTLKVAEEVEEIKYPRGGKFPRPLTSVYGKIWFGGCLMSDCMVEAVTIRLLDELGGENRRTLASATLIPAMEPFPVDGVLFTNSKVSHGLVEVVCGSTVIYRSDLDSLPNVNTSERLLFFSEKGTEFLINIVASATSLARGNV